jgi:ABC-type multidrug transport system fused ATPase/permease subunit
MMPIASDATEPHFAQRSAAALSNKPTSLPNSLFRYIVATSWMHQLLLVTLTVAIFLLEVVPLELQRRVVNDVVKHRQFGAIVLLCTVYLSVVVVQGATKLGLNIYRNWVGESAKRELRRYVLASTSKAATPFMLAEAQGTAVSMTVAEVEPVGGFIGESISEPLLQAGVLASVIGYIVHVDLWMGAAALALFVPQLVFVPLMQHAMNRRTGARVWLLRQIGAGMIAAGNHEARPHDATRRLDRVFQLNMGIFKIKFAMNFLMNLCSHLQVIAALLLGGWWVLQGQLEIGGVVAFISGVGRLTDPWGDLVNYFREVSVTRVKYGMLATAINQFVAESTRVVAPPEAAAD